MPGNKNRKYTSVNTIREIQIVKVQLKQYESGYTTSENKNGKYKSEKCNPEYIFKNTIRKYMSGKYNSEDTNRKIQIRKYKSEHQNRNIQIENIQIGKYESSNTNRNIQIGKYKPEK